MKNIGILTFQYPENRNFGASLQSYACLNLLKKFFKNVELINYYPIYYNYSLKSKLILNLESKNFIEYNEKFLNLTRKIVSNENLNFLNKEFDTFVVGSDQVWRVIWFKNVASHYFLILLMKIKRK